MSKYDILAPTQPSIYEGALNVNVLQPGPVLNGAQRHVLHRFPKENTTILKSIAHEYNTIGFTQVGGRFRRRSQNEQVQFTKKCAELGLNVLPPLTYEGSYVENLFLENAETMDVFLSHATNEETAKCTHNIYMDMYKAHKAGIVYGDRWSENILVVPKIGVVNIDFDVEISGLFAKEFDVAQVSYYILAGAKVKVIPQLAKLLSVPYADLNIQHVETFLCGHAEHFNANKKYGNLKEEVNTLVALMYKEYESHRRNK